ncbi:iron ABC transporter permease [Corallococcus exiguus]|uniref:FecCD family ABC transporter permease n=1 Tax=Corallococcus exiguus TaxID=83462 RepID=UPI0014721749|nr:iron ABC transporter permease [Corallococcus exiguus]NNB97029.1 iron ABC transporter permease [Corallococcus exiguus]NNC06377.1 iron ABC transporter permease [Corallococcus exiguus]
MSASEAMPVPASRPVPSRGPGAGPWVTLGLLLALMVLASLAVGSMTVPPSAILGSLWEALGLGEASHKLDAMQRAVLLTLRLPRMLMAVMVGGVLATTGAALQALFRNPLVEPGLLGTSSGAALGAVLAIVLDVTLAAHVGPFRMLVVPGAAFLGALAATVLALRLGTGGGRTDTPRVLLAGVAVSAGAFAGMGLLTHAASDAQLRTITFWSLGSLGGASWETVGAAAIPLVVTLGLLLSEARALNLMLLGEREAWHLGVDVERLKRKLILAAALGVGAAVSFCGMIGFVGLLVPALLRIALGPDHRRLLAASALSGASLLLAADLLARTLSSPSELPVGALTSVLGVPAFIGLLARKGAA